MQVYISNPSTSRLLTHRLVLTLCLFSAGFLCSCTKEENAKRSYPRLTTLEVSDINENGAVFNAFIVNGNTRSITEYGFVWSQDQNPLIGQSDHQSQQGPPASATFSDTIKSAMQAQQTYYVRAYVKTPDFLVYGKTVTFKSLGSKAPRITGFTPEQATWGDTVHITGDNFGSDAGNLFVKVGTLPAQVISVSPTKVSITLPLAKSSNKVPLSITLYGNTANSTEMFTFLEPTLSSINRLTGTYNDTITLQGTNFSLDKSAHQVLFGNQAAITVYASRTVLKVLVPDRLSYVSSAIRLMGPASETSYPQPFQLLPIFVESFSPDTARSSSDIITLTGRNFNPLIMGNKVFIDNNQVEIVSCTPTRLQVKLPSDISPGILVSYNKTVPLRVETGQQTLHVTSPLVIYWKSKWSRKNNFPGGAYTQGVGFAINGKGYATLGIRQSNNTLDNLLWEYDPATDVWKEKTPFPGPGRIYSSSFVIGQNAYIGLGLSSLRANSAEFLGDFYRYSPGLNTWTKVADHPFPSRSRAAAFTINNQGYVGMGKTGATNNDVNWDFYRYDEGLNQWNPGPRFTYIGHSASGTSVNNNGYLLYNNRVYQLANDSWQYAASVSPGIQPNGWSFTVGNSAFFISSDMLEYNTLTKQVTYYDLPDFVLYCAFSIGSKAYLVTSSQEVWEFDPEKK